MQLAARYQQDVRDGYIREDANQLAVLPKLQRIIVAVAQQESRWCKRLQFALTARYPAIPGLYLWGGVGIGKTYLMDCFFETLPSARKRRFHFHQFMRWLHEQLQQQTGVKNPLQRVAQQVAREVHVLCLDEFLVNDITDAMLLGNLLQALLSRGVLLVTTSNLPPHQLYANGLQRSRFLPAIELLTSYCEVIQLPSQVDYRTQQLLASGTYFTPLTNAEALLEACFRQLTHNEFSKAQTIEVLGRKMPTKAISTQAIWFAFEVLCAPPRSQRDYLELAHQYRLIFVSAVPQFTDKDLTRLAYFIHLVDVCYDTRTKLILSAAVPISQLYPAGRLRHDFARIESRLFAMQAANYLHVQQQPQ